MAKKEIIAFDPPTEEEIMLIQPNNVTFGQYNVSEWQENLLTLIGDKIQKHMTREKELPRDLFNQPYVVIMCDEAGALYFYYSHLFIFIVSFYFDNQDGNGFIIDVIY